MEPIRPGNVGPEVEDVQRRLVDLGLSCPADRGVYDETTRAAVRTFQQQRGLPADGIVGDDTWRALVGASFRLGDRMLYVTRPLLYGDDVLDLQRRLNRLGFDAGYDDGLYGPQTFDAVREFQLNVGVEVDGIAGPSTVELLRRLHRHHQAASAYAVREREQLRHPRRTSVAGTRVMLDPSHSLTDPGIVTSDGLTEHQLVWQLAALMEGQLAALGAHVVLSRGPATSPTPSERAEHANNEDVEAILSLHLGEHLSPVARGVAGYYFGTELEHSEQGRELAELAVTRVTEVMGTPDCRTHPATTAILRESRAPAATVQVGFLTNPDDRSRLSDPASRRAIATAMVDAMVSFLVGPPGQPA
jgi:N-acetylmuramoyl-L-alanine amidase